MSSLYKYKLPFFVQAGAFTTNKDDTRCVFRCIENWSLLYL